MPPLIFVDIILTFIFWTLSECVSSPCPKALTIKITNGTKLGSSIIYTQDLVFTSKNYFTNGDEILGCVCNIKNCIRKCCGPSEVMLNKKCTKNQNVSFDFEIYDNMNNIINYSKTDLFEINNEYCTDNRYLLRRDYDNMEEMFYVQRNGTLLVPSWNKNTYDPEEYCVDMFQKNVNGSKEATPIFSSLICSTDEDLNEISIFNETGMIISMPFLLATFVAYALLPERNLHMKALMSYVFNLFIGYLILVIIQLTDTEIGTILCPLMGYASVFFFIASFFWMNVICADIWFTFSGLKGFSGGKSAERRRFLYYSGYAWGLSIIHILVVFIIDRVSDQTSWFHPGVGTGQCFLGRTYPELLYFYGPLALIIVVNVTLYGITFSKIMTIKRETSVLRNGDSNRHSYENEQKTYNLYLKLLFAMGVNWSMEVISWAVDWGLGYDKTPQGIWYLTDFCNAIYGVFIFFFFVFKRNIWKLLKNRYYSFTGKPYMAHSMTQNLSTRVTSCTTNTSSINDNHSVNETNLSMLRNEA